MGVIPLYRVISETVEVNWNLLPGNNEQYVFCHNDLAQENIIADSKTLTIKEIIIDWEYTGYFPEKFEGEFYNRIGPSVVHNGEKDDVSELDEVLQSQQIQ